MPGRTTYRVTYNSGAGWKVKQDGAQRASSVHSSKADAVERAKDLAKAQKPSQVVIHKADGTIQTEHTYQRDPYPPKG